MAALQQLLASHVPGESAEEQLSATQLRDRLIAHDPGNASWIALINQVCQPDPAFVLDAKSLRVSLWSLLGASRGKPCPPVTLGCKQKLAAP